MNQSDNLGCLTSERKGMAMFRGFCKKEDAFDIFISYRRKGGYATAQALYNSLTRLGYRVSFDLETLRGGKFNEQLYKRIDGCSDVLAIISQDALVLREDREDDWFRLEIAHAIQCKKNIVPVILQGVEFPPTKREMPADIAELVTFNGVAAAPEHYDSVLRKICEKFVAKPIRKTWHSFLLMSVAALTVVGMLIWKELPYPFTEGQRQEVATWIGEMMLLGDAYNEYMSAVNDLLKSGRLSVDTGTGKAYDDEVQLFEKRWKTAKVRLDSAIGNVQKLLGRQSGMDVKVEDVRVWLESLSHEFRAGRDLVELAKCVAGSKSCFDKANRYRYFDVQAKIQAIYGELFVYQVMGIFHNVSPSSLDDFRVIARKWTALPSGLGEDNAWLKEEKAIGQKMEALCNQQETMAYELAMIVGNEMKRLR